MPVTLLYASHGRNACGLVRLATAPVGPAAADGSRTSEIRNGTCNMITVTATIAMPFILRVNATAAIRGAATKIPDRCDWTAAQAKATAIAICQEGLSVVMDNAVAVAILINAADTGG